MGNESLEKEGDGFLGSLSLFLLFASLFVVLEILFTLTLFLFMFSSLFLNPLLHLHTRKMNLLFLFISVKSALLSLCRFHLSEIEWCTCLSFLSSFLTSKWIHFSFQTHNRVFVFNSFILTSFTFISSSPPSKSKGLFQWRGDLQSFSPYSCLFFLVRPSNKRYKQPLQQPPLQKKRGREAFWAVKVGSWVLATLPSLVITITKERNSHQRIVSVTYHMAHKETTNQ